MPSQVLLWTYTKTFKARLALAGGSSGSPILNNRSEIVGIIHGSAEGSIFAIRPSGVIPYELIDDYDNRVMNCVGNFYFQRFAQGNFTIGLKQETPYNQPFQYQIVLTANNQPDSNYYLNMTLKANSTFYGSTVIVANSILDFISFQIKVVNVQPDIDINSLTLYINGFEVEGRNKDNIIGTPILLSFINLFGYNNLADNLTLLGPVGKGEQNFITSNL